MSLHVEQLQGDIVLFRGDQYESIATAFIRDSEALLVDTLASSADAEQMRDHLQKAYGAQVRVVVMTHYMSDHMAGLSLFRTARIVAHRLHRFTFLTQRDRTLEEDQAYVAPTVLVDRQWSVRWGHHHLRAFHNPGKTVCSLAVDVADADLLLCGDTLVGNTIYLSSSAPELIDNGLATLERLGRRQIIGGHIGVLPQSVVGNARSYLSTLGALAKSAWEAMDPQATLQSIQIEDCLASGLHPTEFERYWHTRNLYVIEERGLFRLPSPMQLRNSACAVGAPH